MRSNETEFTISDMLAVQQDPALIEAVRAFYQSAGSPGREGVVHEEPPRKEHVPNLVSPAALLEEARAYAAETTDQFSEDDEVIDDVAEESNS